MARRFGIRPSHEMGQNFLVDRRARDAIMAVVGQPSRVLEIGAGLGALTQGLLEQGTTVLAAELDPRCVSALGLLGRHHEGLRVLPGDILDWLPRLEGEVFDEVVGNLPFQLTGTLLPRLLRRRPQLGVAHLLVQREVARRLAAGPGDWSLSTLALRLGASVVVEFDLGPESFWPRPKVHSSLISIRPEGSIAPELAERLLALARPLFQARRKQLHNGLSAALGGAPREAAELLRQAGIEPSRRPGTLGVEEWRQLLTVCSGAKEPVR